MQRCGFDFENVTLKGLEVEAGREMGFSLERSQLILTLITYNASATQCQVR